MSFKTKNNYCVVAINRVVNLSDNSGESAVELELTKVVDCAVMEHNEGLVLEVGHNDEHQSEVPVFVPPTPAKRGRRQKPAPALVHEELPESIAIPIRTLTDKVPKKSALKPKSPDASNPSPRRCRLTSKKYV